MIIDLLDDRVVHSMRRTGPEHPVFPIQNVYRASIRSGQLSCFHDDSGQDSFEIDARIDGLTDDPERS